MFLVCRYIAIPNSISFLQLVSVTVTVSVFQIVAFAFSHAET